MVQASELIPSSESGLPVELSKWKAPSIMSTSAVTAHADETLAEPRT